jgi:nitrate reductase gamma subunit
MYYNEKKIITLKFCKPAGECAFSNKLKMACARDFNRILSWWVKKVFGVNCRTKFQTICFSLTPLTIHANLHLFLKNQPFERLINAFAYFAYVGKCANYSRALDVVL